MHVLEYSNMLHMNQISLFRSYEITIRYLRLSYMNCELDLYSFESLSKRLRGF